MEFSALRYRVGGGINGRIDDVEGQVGMDR